MLSKSTIWNFSAMFICSTLLFATILPMSAISQEPLLSCKSLDNNLARRTLFNQCRALNSHLVRQRKELEGLKESLQKENQQLAQKCTKLGQAYWKAQINGIKTQQQKDEVILVATKKRSKVLQTQNNDLLQQLAVLKKQNGKFRSQQNDMIAERDRAKEQSIKLAGLVETHGQKVDGLKNKIKALEEMNPSGQRLRRVAIPKDCPDCPELMRIFVDDKTKIGVPGDHVGNQNNALPQIIARLPEDFATTKTEITVRQFMAFVNAKYNGKFARRCILRVGLGGRQKGKSIVVHTPSVFAALGLSEPKGIANHPAVCISKTDAKNYAAWLNEVAGSGKNFRLLSEVEWEYSARAQLEHAPLAPASDYSMCNLMNLADLSLAQFANEKTKGKHFTLTSRDVAHCWDTNALTTEVGKLGAANAYGLYDILGNVAEMTRDCWFSGDDAAIDPGGVAVLTGPDVNCDFTAVRGGSFSSSPNHATLWFKEKIKIMDRTSIPHMELGYFDVGFRLRRDL